MITFQFDTTTVSEIQVISNGDNLIGKLYKEVDGYYVFDPRPP